MSRKQSAKFRIDEPIGYDELLAASAMDGLVSFLDLPAKPENISSSSSGTTGIPSEDRRILGTRVVSATGIPDEPGLSTGIQDGPSSDIPDNQPVATGIPSNTAPPSGIPNDLASSPGIPNNTESSIGIPSFEVEEGSHDKRRQTPETATDTKLLNTTPGIPSLLSSSPGIPNIRYAQVIEARRLRPFRLKLVQDGHSRNEQAIYDELWRAGHPIQGSADKFTEIGYGELARRARVSRNSVIRLLLSLERKFSVERHNREASQAGSWYTVRHYDSILESRRKAGLLWAVKDRNGVVLLTREDVLLPHLNRLGIPNEPTVGIPNDPSSGIPNMRSSSFGMHMNGMPSIPSKALPGIPNEPGPPKYLKETSKQDVVAQLVKDIKRQTDSPPWDRTVAEALWKSCEAKGIRTISELMYFFTLKWQVVRLKRNMTNPVGLMGKAVPESISSEALETLRRELASVEEEDQGSRDLVEQEEWRARHLAVLNDPNASDQEKRVAHSALTNS